MALETAWSGTAGRRKPGREEPAGAVLNAEGSPQARKTTASVETNENDDTHETRATQPTGNLCSVATVGLAPFRRASYRYIAEGHEAKADRLNLKAEARPEVKRPRAVFEAIRGKDLQDRRLDLG